MSGIKPKSAIDRAIEAAGGQEALRIKLESRGLVITQQGISHWKRKGYAIQAHHSAISQAVGRKVLVSELKADFDNRRA